MKKAILASLLLLTACEQRPEQPKLDVPTNATQDISQPVQPQQPGMLEHMAGAAVAGAAAGSAGAVAHRATDHFINKRQARRQHRTGRTYNHRR